MKFQHCDLYKDSYVIVADNYYNFVLYLCNHSFHVQNLIYNCFFSS